VHHHSIVGVMLVRNEGLNQKRSPCSYFLAYWWGGISPEADSGEVYRVALSMGRSSIINETGHGDTSIEASGSVAGSVACSMACAVACSVAGSVMWSLVSVVLVEVGGGSEFLRKIRS